MQQQTDSAIDTHSVMTPEELEEFRNPGTPKKNNDEKVRASIAFTAPLGAVYIIKRQIKAQGATDCTCRISRADGERRWE